MDNSDWNGKPGGQNGAYATGTPIGQSGMTVFSSAPNGIHTDGSNYLVCDGHVKWLKAALISPGKDAATATTPESDANHKAAGTSYMNVSGGAQNSAVLTMSKI
jgi:prepilin-type processing-associated H-X9-DG protein